MIQINHNLGIRFVGDGEYVIVNGKSYRTPDKPIFKTTRSICVVDNKVYVNGYELVKGRWKITISSLFHLFF